MYNENQNNSIKYLNDLSGKPSDQIKEEIQENQKIDEKQNTDSQKSEVTKFYVIRKLIDLFLELEQGEKKQGRKDILFLCKILITFIVVFEVFLIVAQGFGWMKLDKVIFLGTIGTITSGVVFLLKVVTKSLYNDESDKVLKTVEAIINKL
ncbi:MAG: hypothetical protein ACRC6E_02940 [Fusobacteriaceae bacterium]